MKTLLFVLGSIALAFAGIAVWMSYELWRANQLLRRVSKMLSPPEIERDAQGRPLRERV